MAQPSEKLCLWNGRALFLGNLPDLAMHQQAAALVCVGLEKPFELSRGDETVSCRAALIGPQILHEIRTSGARCAFLFFDPDNPDYEFLIRSNSGKGREGIIPPLAEEARLIEMFSAIAACQDESALSDHLEKLELSRSEKNPLSFDERIGLVVRRLASESGENVPIEELAALAGLSPSRLAHLFKEQVGIPIRMFRTWFRLKNAVLFAKEGMTLTDAALRAGFYDSAHFANTFRETFGIAPSAIFGSERKILWHIGDSNLPALAQQC
jgi:AraC-like DNA-binding protein